MRLDIHQASWAGLFDLLAMCENFVFYSPLMSSAALVEQQRAAVAAQASLDLFAKMRSAGPGARRTASAINAATTGARDTTTATGNAVVESDAFLARPKDSRRFKVVGLHMTSGCGGGGGGGVGGGTAATATDSEDLVLVEKIIEMLVWFKFAELESSMDANAEPADRSDNNRTTQGNTDSHFGTHPCSLMLPVVRAVCFAVSVRRS